MSSLPLTTRTQNHRIAYHFFKGSLAMPSIIFCGGFRSSMEGTKAMALDQWCRRENRNFLRFDYLGHGASGMDFTEGSISLWKDNLFHVIDTLTEGPLLLVGSSMGGWLMVLAAMERKHRIQGLVGMASAPDFTERHLWHAFSQKEREDIQKNNVIDVPSSEGPPYRITYDLIKDGRKHCILQKKIEVECPVRLIHGMQDDCVPYQDSILLSQALASNNVEVILIKDGDHRLSKEGDLRTMCQVIKNLV